MLCCNPRLITCKIFLLICLLGSVVRGNSQGSATIEAPCKPEVWHSIAGVQSQDNADLQFLKKLVAGKRIILIGESSHGIGDYYTQKSRIIMYLHKECGFDVLAMESGIADIHLAYKHVDSLSAKQIRNQTVFGNFQCEEIMPLFDYIKSTASSARPLYYSGFDSQNFSGSFSLIQKILRNKWGSKGDSLVGCLSKYFRIPVIMWDEDKQPLVAISDSIRGAATMIASFFRDSSASIRRTYGLTATDMDYLQRSLQNQLDAVQLDWTKDDPSSHRDKVMAGNLFWLMDSVYPNRKIIIWAHNGHVGRSSAEGNPYTWLGEYVAKKYGRQSYHIGLFARVGQTYEWWTKTNKAFANNQSDDIEQLASLAEITYIDFAQAVRSCPWPRRQVFGFELENGGRIGFIPQKRFDAIITFKNVGLPTYTN